MLLGLLRDIHPSLVVAAGIVAVGLVHQHKATPTHTTAEDAVLQRVPQALLHLVHVLLADRGIENGLCTVLMQEGDSLIGGHNAVRTGPQSLGGCKLIAGLKGFALGQQDVACAPVFIRGSHHLLDTGTHHVDVYHRFLHVSPQLDARPSVGNLDIALAKMQYLPEMVHVQSRRQTDAEASLLEQRVVLVKRPRARQVEQHVAMLHPHIHAHVAATTRHRL